MKCTCSIASSETSIYCPVRERSMTPHLLKKCATGQLPAAPADPLACIHRGAKIGEVDCGCNVPETIYACESREVESSTCTRGKKKPGWRHAVCLGCDQREPVDLSRVTATITEFRRPQALKRLLASIERFYPQLAIDVEPTAGNLSAARNRLAARCVTEFMLVLEEDFELTPQTDLARLLTVVDSNQNLLGAAGACNEPKRGRVVWRHDFHHSGDRVAIAASQTPAANIDGVRFQLCSLVLNFGLFRRDLIRQVGWDENLPVQEHWDFFYRVARQRGAHQFAHVPAVSIDHHRDRPPGYEAFRNRRFDDYLVAKHGFAKPETPRVGVSRWPVVGADVAVAGDNQHQLTSIDPLPKAQLPAMRPNLVLLGVGHANTTITARQLAALGWNLADADAEYAESVSIRALNRRLLAAPRVSTRLQADAATALAALPTPWVIKDPRFVFTLDRWRDLLAPHAPALVWVQKDFETVLASFRRRGESITSRQLRRRFRRAEKQFHNFTGPKLAIRAEQIAAACTLFQAPASFQAPV